MLQLHVWGSAFGLPSIDAECLAAITYLHNALPSSEWHLIPSHAFVDFLPALNHDGVWTCGYRAIVDYLVSRGYDLDGRLDPARRARVVSASAYLRARAAPLVDLSLYASGSNWAAATRPAYSTLLRFPLTWTVPTLIRAEAVARVGHLGLADLDADFGPDAGGAAREALPGAVWRHLPVGSKATSVKQEMTPEQAVAIRLFALAEDCFDVLRGFFDGDQDTRVLGGGWPAVSSLDCLLFAHLALMIKPPVPRSFLADCMVQKAPRLRNYVDDVIAQNIVARGPLPWAAPEPVTLSALMRHFLDSTLRHVPSLGDLYADEVRSRAEQGRAGLDRRTLGIVAGLLVAAVAAGFGVVSYKAALPFGALAQTWRARRQSRLGDFGVLGSMLSSALGPLPSSHSGRGAAGIQASGRSVVADSEVD